MKGEEIKDYFIVGIDIAQYSLKSLEDQKGSQLAIDRALAEAVRNGAPRKNGAPLWLDAGDGGYALFGWASGREVLDVVKIFAETLARENRTRAPDHALSVRLALHHGQVVCWKGEKGARYTSHAINQCARFLAGTSRDPGRIVCSKIFLEKISAIDEYAKAKRLKDIVDKHGIQHQIYNLHQAPGLGLPPNDLDEHENPFL